jgi:hypothetical protein
MKRQLHKQEEALSMADRHAKQARDQVIITVTVRTTLTRLVTAVTPVLTSAATVWYLLR